MIEINLPAKFQALLKPARYKIFYGGRGGAKSWSFAQALVGEAYLKPLRILCTREFQNSIADSVHRLIRDQITALGLDPWYKVTQTSITSSCGSQFIFKGLQRSIQEIKSTEGIDICWVEEGQNTGENSWEILIPTIRAENNPTMPGGSEIWISFNPNEESDPTYQRFVVNTPPNSVCQKVGWQDNPHFPKVLEAERRYMLKIDPDAYQNVWEGFCRQMSDAVIFRGRFEVGAFDEPGEDVRLYHGIDWGFSQDPQALVRCWIRDNKLFVDQEAYGIGVELDDLQEFIERIPTAKQWPLKADNSRPETISHARRRGFAIDGAPKWPGSVEDGVAVLKGFEKIIIHERCKHTAEEFRLYSYKVDKQTNDILPKIEDKHNHCIDAIRYALAGVIKQSNFFDNCGFEDEPEDLRIAA